MKEKKFIVKSVELALQGVRSNSGGPFGAIIVKNGKIIGAGWNQVTSKNDPTAHAEITAIREACKNINNFQLTDCEIYCSCEPCPMCLGAIYWSRISKVYYACDKNDAARSGFDDDFIYKELEIDHNKRRIKFINLPFDNCDAPFIEWNNKSDKIKY